MNNRTSNAKVKRFKDRSILVFKRSKDCKFWIGALLSCTLLLIYVYIKTHGERERGGEGLYHYIIILPTISHYIVDTESNSLHHTIVIHGAKYLKFSRSYYMYCTCIYIFCFIHGDALINSASHYVINTRKQLKLLQITTLLIHTAMPLRCCYI